MTIKLNHDQLDHHGAAPRGDAETRVADSSLYGAISGQIAVGRRILRVGEPSGAVVREASRTERAHIRPRPTPVLLRPRSTRGLLDRGTEQAVALSAFDAGIPVEVSGAPGVGTTVLLRHLAHHPRAASFVDGIVYVRARHHTSADLQQLLFEAFNESDEICKPTDAEIRRALQHKQALILLDDVRMAPHELEQVLDIAPRSAFAVATRERCLWGEVRSVALNGLPVDDAVLLLEREVERSLDDTEVAAAATLCAALGGHPRRIVQAAAIAREQGMSLDVCARAITPANLVSESMASIDEKSRRALLALAALPGVPLRVQDIAGIADVTDLESALMMLTRRGIVVSSDSRHRLAAGIADHLRRTDDLKPWVNRAITYFTAWSERHRRNPGSLLEESEALVHVQQSAAEARRWGEVLRVGRLLEGALIVGARWGAWAVTLEHCLAAARALGDRNAEAWALHEIGTRALCLGDPRAARASLRQAATLRDASGDAGAAAASRQNLDFVFMPEPDPARERATGSRDRPLDLDSLPLREHLQPLPRSAGTNHVGGLMLADMLAAIIGGLAYWAGPSWQRWNLVSIGSFLHGSLDAAVPPPHDRQPRVLQFSTAPDRIAPGETVRLCYDVENGARVQIEPDIGNIDVLPRHCVSATPAETTTYMLTAYSAGGQHVNQTAIVVVGGTGSRAFAPDNPGSLPLGSELDTRASDPPVTPLASASDRASILIFSPRPGSVTTGGPTRLCYAVSNAVWARVEPRIGDVPPSSTLSCLRVTPARTTTYELTASGRDGQQVRQQLVIIVQ